MVLGALYRASKKWTFGAVLKPAYTMHFDRDLQATLLFEDYDDKLRFPFGRGCGRGVATLPNTDPVNRCDMDAMVSARVL